MPHPKLFSHATRRTALHAVAKGSASTARFHGVPGGNTCSCEAGKRITLPIPRQIWIIKDDTTAIHWMWSMDVKRIQVAVWKAPSLPKKPVSFDAHQSSDPDPQFAVKPDLSLRWGQRSRPPGWQQILHLHLERLLCLAQRCGLNVFLSDYELDKLHLAN